MKVNGDIADTPYRMEDHVNTSIYEDALKIMIEHGSNRYIQSVNGRI